jgi:hypothetical protein
VRRYSKYYANGDPMEPEWVLWDEEEEEEIDWDLWLDDGTDEEE